MNREKAKATVQYNDLEGTVAIDWHDSINGLNDFALSQAIDLQDYIPVGVSVFLGESRGSELDTASVSIFAVDPTHIGRDFEEIRFFVKSNKGILPCKRFRFEISLPELLKFFKRFNLNLVSRYIEGIEEFQFE